MNSSQNFLSKTLKLLLEFSKKLQLPENVINITDDAEECNISSSQLRDALIELAFDIKTIVDEDQASSKLANSVQITASKSQLDQRIAAFQHHAQSAVNQQNIEEFFPTKADATSIQGGCARTHAVYRRRLAKGTHVQVLRLHLGVEDRGGSDFENRKVLAYRGDSENECLTRVKNVDGPQTQIDSQGRWSSIKRKKSQPVSCPEGVQERLKNLEQHMGINQETASKEVYARLKVLEEKVLKLEAISPEYFHELREQRSERPDFVANETHNLSLDQIDDRIKILKKRLLSKKMKIG